MKLMQFKKVCQVQEEEIKISHRSQFRRNLDDRKLDTKKRKPRLLTRQCHLQPVQEASPCGFGAKERGTRVKDRAKNGPSKRVGRGWPKPKIPFSVFLCSETKRIRLLRRLCPMVKNGFKFANWKYVNMMLRTNSKGRCLVPLIKV